MCPGWHLSTSVGFVLPKPGALAPQLEGRHTPDQTAWGPPATDLLECPRYVLKRRFLRLFPGNFLTTDLSNVSTIPDLPCSRIKMTFWVEFCIDHWAREWRIAPQTELGTTSSDFGKHTKSDDAVDMSIFIITTLRTEGRMTSLCLYTIVQYLTRSANNSSLHKKCYPIIYYISGDSILPKWEIITYTI